MITAMIRVRSVLVVAAITFLASNSAQAASITVDANGILLGAKDVMVNGTPYDVEFIDGTCATVFGACDVAFFAFTTESDAHDASSALFDQVLVDGALGNFNSDQKLTNGCNTALETDQCFVLTPYATFSDAFGAAFRFSTAINTFGAPLVDSTVEGYAYVSYDAAADVEGVFAKWTAIQSVPDDTSTLSLVGLSVATIFALRRAL